MIRVSVVAYSGIGYSRNMPTVENCVIPARASSIIEPPIVARIRECVIGDDRLMDGPYGQKPVTYADYTASGRSLSFIEEFLRDEVLPRYANTHTESSGTGLQTTRLREDARDTIRRAVNGDENTLVIFAGSGTTGAIDKMVGILELRLPRGLLDEATSVLRDTGFTVEVDFDGEEVKPIDVAFDGELRPEQRAAVTEMLRYQTGVLVAPPGAGKTVMACALIAERATPTAILVNRADLLQQWRTRLTEFLGISDKQIGQLGGGRRKLTDLINHSVGLEMLVRVGDAVEAEQPLLRLFADLDDGQRVAPLVQQAIKISEEVWSPLTLVVERIGD